MSVQVEEADYSRSGLVANRSITVVKTPDRYEEAIDICVRMLLIDCSGLCASNPFPPKLNLSDRLLG